MSAVDAALSGADVRRLAIIGTAKNVGKTVALNALLAGLGERGGRVRRDVGRARRRGPRRPGLRRSSSRGSRCRRVRWSRPRCRCCDEGARARSRSWPTTPFRTPLGRVVVGRMGAGGGEVEIAGPGSASAVRKVTDLMFSLGAARVIIDGSLDRRAAANPSVSDGVILATGAVLDLDRGEVVRRTATAAALLRLPRVADEALRTLAAAARGHLAVIDGDGVPLPREFVLRGDAEPDPKWDRLLGDASALVIRGALTEPFLDARRAGARRRRRRGAGADDRRRRRREGVPRRAGRSALRGARDRRRGAGADRPAGRDGQPGRPRLAPLRRRASSARTWRWRSRTSPWSTWSPGSSRARRWPARDRALMLADTVATAPPALHATVIGRSVRGRPLRVVKVGAGRRADQGAGRRLRARDRARGAGRHARAAPRARAAARRRS